MFNVKRYFFTLNIELFYNQFPVETISISDGSYSLGFSYPRRFKRVAAMLDRPFSFMSAIRYSP